MSEHLSAFALDVLALSDEDNSHLARCARCQALLSERKSGSVLPPDLRARALERRSPRAWWLGGGFAVALAGALCLFLLLPTPQVRAKGGPALELFIKRGEAVRRWEPGVALSAGDHLLLCVDPAGYTHTKVSDGETVLFEGALPADRSTPLPVSFKVDAAAGEEHLRVELTGGGQPGWFTDLQLPKENR